MLEAVYQAAAHRILGGEQKGEDDHSHLTIAEIVASLVGRIPQNLDPLIKHTFWLSTAGHGNFGFGGSHFKPLESSFTGLNGLPDICSGKCKGEVDKLESASDIPVFFGDFDEALFGDVIATKHADRGVHVQITSCLHNLLRRRVPSCVSEPLTEVLAGDGILYADVNAVIWSKALLGTAGQLSLLENT